MMEFIIIFILMGIIMLSIYIAYLSHIRWIRVQKFADYHLSLMSENKQALIEINQELIQIRYSFEEEIKKETLMCGKDPDKVCDLCGDQDCLFHRTPPLKELKRRWYDAK